ncbi:MAG TPA: hypothetical protein VN255_04345 [Mycobacterium sp.]|nr:hypothetical protein [Mycobacterium sp.]
MAQLVEHQANGQNRLPRTRGPEHDHPLCLLATEIRADVREHPGSITCGQPQTGLGPKFKIIDNHVAPAAQFIEKDRFPATNSVREVVGIADQCRA